MKTVTARYKTVQEQLLQKPYRYKDEQGRWQYIARTLGGGEQSSSAGHRQTS